MRGILISVLTAAYLYGASEPQNIISEVSKLRQKYEECRQGQSVVSGITPKVYDQCEAERKDSMGKVKILQSRITMLETQLKQNEGELVHLKQRNGEVEKVLFQKQGVMKSLEQTLASRDKKLRDTLSQYDALNEQANTAKVSRIERQTLTESLEKAKGEVSRLEGAIAKSSKERIAMEKELTDAKARIDKFRNTRTVAPVAVAESQKSISPAADQSGKIKALQDELSRANTMIVQLQHSTPSAAKEKVVIQEKIVEKVVYRDRPVEKNVAKGVESTGKITALQRELAAAQAKLVNLKNNPSNTVIKEKIVEKVVYKDRPVVQEKTSDKALEATEKLNRALQQKLAEDEARVAKLKAQTPKLVVPKVTKMTAQSILIPEKKNKTSVDREMKVITSEIPKKSGPSAYRMATNAPVYNAPGGSVVDTWEEKRSFTSGTTANGWVKITGYFVNRVWTSAERDLWVKESDVIRR